jgi:hypothetical protein
VQFAPAAGRSPSNRGKPSSNGVFRRVNTWTANTNWTTGLLARGVVAAHHSSGSRWIEALTREGFDLRRHAISMLSLGDLGWIQVTNFLASGLLTVFFAIGVWKRLRRGGAGTSGPLLIGIFGVGVANSSGAGVPFVLAAAVLARACHFVATVPRRAQLARAITANNGSLTPACGLRSSD